MIRTREELLEAIRTNLGEDASDTALSLIEDVTDTFNDLEEKGKGQENWKQKYEDNDKAWRQKYRDRFYAPTSDFEEEEFEEEKPAKLRFEDLFKTEE